VQDDSPREKTVKRRKRGEKDASHFACWKVKEQSVVTKGEVSRKAGGGRKNGPAPSTQKKGRVCEMSVAIGGRGLGTQRVEGSMVSEVGTTTACTGGGDDANFREK